MTKIERVQRALAGEQTDRVPFSIWFHFGTQHLPGERTASIHVDFFRAYDLDWLKVMSDYRYPMPPGVHEISGASQLSRFRRFEMQSPPFDQQLRCLRALREQIGDEAPFIETVFSPFGVARRTLRSGMRRIWEESPVLFKNFLESVTETLQRYVEAVAQTGAAGVFYSINGADQSEMDAATFREWVLPYDRAVLETARRLAQEGRFYFNVAHIHGVQLRWEPVLKEYPVHAFNWSVHHTPPSLAQARACTSRALVAGIDEVGLTGRTPSEVAAQVRQAIQEAGPGGLLVGPGCAVPTETPSDLIRAAREACAL